MKPEKRPPCWQCLQVQSSTLELNLRLCICTSAVHMELSWSVSGERGFMSRWNMKAGALMSNLTLHVCHIAQANAGVAILL